MRRPLNVVGSIPLLAAALLAACGSQSNDEGGGQMQVHSARSSSDMKGDRMNGRKVFLRENCYICHGGRAGGGMCPSLRGRDVDVDVVLKGTESGMPNFTGRVTEREVGDIEAYFASLRTPNEPTFTHWWEAFPSQ